MLYSALAFLAGVSLLQLFPVLPAPAWRWLGLALPLVMVPAVWLRAVVFAVAGLLWAWWHAAGLLAAQLPAHLEGVDVTVEGVIQGLPERRDGAAVRFRFAIERIDLHDDWRAMQLPVRLNWYRQAPVLEPGQRWQLRVRLKRPHGYANPGGFDYERWLFARGVRATGYVRQSPVNVQLAAARDRPVQRLRAYLAARLDRAGLPADSGALLCALGVGDRSGLSRHDWTVLQRTGTSHLLAISGLHVGLVAGLSLLLVQRLWRSVGVPRAWPAVRVAALIAVMMAFAYAVLSGFQVPAQRALVMVALCMAWLFWPGRASFRHVWSCALWVVLLLDPLAVLQAGFWLSFCAVAVIAGLSAGRAGAVSRWRRALWVQCGLWVGLAPLLIVWFQQLAPVAPLANLVAVPWVGLLVVPPLLLGMLTVPLPGPLADFLLTLAAWLVAALWWLLQQLSALPWGLWRPSLSSPGWLLPAVAGLVCLLLPRAVPAHRVGLLLLVPVLLIPQPRPASGGLWLTVLDVGQGLAAVIETRRHVLVFDTGPAFRSGLDSGEAVVAPYLASRGYRRVDRLVVSHADNDHAGGARSLFQLLDIQRIDAGEPQHIDWARSQYCHDVGHWRWDGVEFRYLSPAIDPRTGGNNASCVLRVETAGGRVLLLTGDIERRVERRLLARHDTALAADVLLAPHHGSRTSSTQDFVDAVAPTHVLFATGYRNRWGFPKPDIVERYRRRGARAFDTASTGAIRVEFPVTGPPHPGTARAQHRRYWHWP